jgi:hypothetical protein
MAKHHQYDHIRQLLNCIVKTGLGEDDVIDEIIGACILIVADNPSEVMMEVNLLKADVCIKKGKKKGGGIGKRKNKKT